MLDKFIMNNYKSVKEFSNTKLGLTELVVDTSTILYIRKIINQENSAYVAISKLDETCFVNLVRINYACIKDGKTYGIEEYLEGENLQEKLNRGFIFTDKMVIEIALEIAKALQVLHAADILHRDIKPGNIMQLKDGTIKLIDLGSARFYTKENSRDTVILGTKDFAPPEQFGYSTTDKRSDIFALGKTMEALLPENYSGPLTSIIDRAAAFDPRQRIASADELIKLLEKTKSSADNSTKSNGNNKQTLFLIIGLIIFFASFFTYLHKKPAPLPAQQVTTQVNQVKDNTKDKSLIPSIPINTKTKDGKIPKELITIEISPLTGNPWILKPVKDEKRLAKFTNLTKNGYTMVEYEVDPKRHIISPFGLRITNLSDTPFDTLELSIFTMGFGVVGTRQTDAIKFKGGTVPQFLNKYDDNNMVARTINITYPNNFSLKDKKGRAIYDFFLTSGIKEFFIDNEHMDDLNIHVGIWAKNLEYTQKNFAVKLKK